MDKIKAIETEYKGYKFRSRLEARWAVFFDSLGVKYEYEKQGFELDDGTRYLPDFYLPDFDVYAEVKPDIDSNKEDIKRCEKLVTWGSPIRKLIFLADVPDGDCKDGGMPHFPALYGTCGYPEWKWWYFYCDDGETLEDGAIKIDIRGSISSAWKNNRIYRTSAVSDTILRKERVERAKKDADVFNGRTQTEDSRRMQLMYNEPIFDAFTKARQARFEHGETPKTSGDHKLDFDSEIKSRDSFMLLPIDREYVFTVTDFERDTFDGNAKIPPCKSAKLTLKIPYEGYDVTVRTWLPLYSTMEHKIFSFFRSLGMVKDGERLTMKWNEVIGKRGRCTILHYDGKNGNRYNGIDEFLNYNPALMEERT